MTGPGTIELATPYVDVRAAGLRWALGLPERPAVALLDLEGPDGTRVTLRVLGASHQVVVTRPGRPTFTETVACDLLGSASMPAGEVHDGYAFTSEVVALGPDALAEQVDALEADLTDDSRAIVARFPGTPYAVTAIALDRPATAGSAPADLAWTTWHAYPQSGELVRTHTILRAEEMP